MNNIYHCRDAAANQIEEILFDGVKQFLKL